MSDGPRATASIAPLAFHQGEYVPLAEAALPLTVQGLHYGTGVFEGIRAHAVAGHREVVLFRAVDHYRRFLDSCRLLRIELPYSAEDLTDLTAELLRRNDEHRDLYLRPLAYKLGLRPGARPGVGLASASDAFSLVAYAMGSYLPGEGVRCQISSWTRPDLGAVPVQAKLTGGYVNNALAADEARAAGYDDALLVNARGQLTEASTANVFVVRDGTVVTPPPDAGLLPGITRDTVLTLCASLGIPAAQQHLHQTEVLTADEVFLTGTGVGVVPVVEVSGRKVGDGAAGTVTVRLAHAYRQAIEKGRPGHEHWHRRVPLGGEEELFRADGSRHGA